MKPEIMITYKYIVDVEYANILRIQNEDCLFYESLKSVEIDISEKDNETQMKEKLIEEIKKQNKWDLFNNPFKTIFLDLTYELVEKEKKKV